MIWLNSNINKCIYGIMKAKSAYTNYIISNYRFIAPSTAQFDTNFNQPVQGMYISLVYNMHVLSY